MSAIEGQAAPAFTLNDQEGHAVSLASLHGKQVVLFFYPKDDTPGCTMEACAFRDDLSEFASHNAVIFGVSRDDGASHKNFISKFNLTFPLLVDDGGKVAEAYGVLQEGKFIRSTYLIAADGAVKKIWQPVNVTGHSQDVLLAVKSS